jgi:hypothetical protein
VSVKKEIFWREIIGIFVLAAAGAVAFMLITYVIRPF